jgi:dTDP-4-amino-4,6-dideoxygalactose transaminase
MAGPGAYCFGDEERSEVMDVLSSGHLSRYGDPDDPGFKRKVYTFEQEFAKYCGTKYAVATNSGTAALLISLLSIGVCRGDEVLVPGYTYVASISTIIYTQATPVLVEIDESLTMDPKDLEKKITKKTKAIMVVHMLGNPCNMTEITRIAKKYNLQIIEDGCQAAGGSYKGRKLGSVGEMGAFSLNRYKNIAAGDGGILVTNDKKLFERAFAIHDQGHVPNRIGKDATGTLIGLNLKMNELTGAVALAQLRKLDTILNTLRKKKKFIKSELLGIKNAKFRTINDETGECATILTIIFNTREQADKVSALLESKTLIHSGWHVYRNMAQIVHHKTPTPDWSDISRYSSPGSLPVTDDILSRSINISIGVVDVGLGAGFGININSSDEEIKEVIDKIIDVCK